VRTGLVDPRFEVLERVTAFRFGEDFDRVALRFAEARFLLCAAFVLAGRRLLAELCARFLRAAITAPDTAPIMVPTTGVPTALPITAPATAPPKVLPAAPLTLDPSSFLLSLFMFDLPFAEQDPPTGRITARSGRKGATLPAATTCHETIRDVSVTDIHLSTTRASVASWLIGESASEHLPIKGVL
jgi:hypothetical protein